RYSHEDVMENAVTVASLKAKSQHTDKDKPRRSRRRPPNRQIAAGRGRVVQRSRRPGTRNVPSGYIPEFPILAAGSVCASLAGPVGAAVVAIPPFRLLLRPDT